VEEFVDDHSLTQVTRLFEEIKAEGDDATGRARRPLAGHLLHLDASWVDADLVRP
jgi:hypothetical protein